MSALNTCIGCEWWTGEVCECPPGMPCHSETYDPEELDEGVL